MIIDCTECEMYQTEHCQDCFVMAVLSKSPEEPLVLDEAEEEAVTLLQEAGLAPVIKFKRKAG